MIISFKGYDDSGGLHTNHMNENQPNRAYFHRFGYRIFGIYIYSLYLCITQRVCIMEEIIGRKDEIRRLTDYYNSGKSEFIDIYGRRRIGI